MAGGRSYRRTMPASVTSAASALLGPGFPKPARHRLVNTAPKYLSLAHDGLQGGDSKRPIKEPNSLLPRARTLCTNSKNPR